MNRPEKRNALSYELIKDLKEAFALAERDDSVKIIVFKANGPVFCAGADLDHLQKLQGFSHEEILKDSEHLKELFLQIYTLKKVVIAQVQGHALAGGCGLATVCDLVYAASEAKFGYTEVKIGFVPAVVMVFLLRKIGEAKAKQLLLTGELISAKEALDFGLINGVLSHARLDEEVTKVAQKMIKGNSAQSMMVTKEMIGTIQSFPLDKALQYAAENNAKARASEDYKRGIAAFLSKQKFSW
jgi:methylglutaconyl-CoA hydratase